jgi:nitrite reductase (NADH) small subunit/3-phenylpropionate/trans-cinnamate dioxygenase ferredoxin subunit
MDRVDEPVAAPPSPNESWFAVADVTELADGEVMEVRVDGSGPMVLALARIDGEFHAVSNSCPHAGGPIGDGDVDGTQVRCPLHGWGFDVRDGVCDVDPALRLAVFATRVRDGRVEVEVPGAE